MSEPKEVFAEIDSLIRQSISLWNDGDRADAKELLKQANNKIAWLEEHDDNAPS